jgi:hypothetical protein
LETRLRRIAGAAVQSVEPGMKLFTIWSRNPNRHVLYEAQCQSLKHLNYVNLRP